MIRLSGGREAVRVLPRLSLSHQPEGRRTATGTVEIGLQAQRSNQCYQYLIRDRFASKHMTFQRKIQLGKLSHLSARRHVIGYYKPTAALRL